MIEFFGSETVINKQLEMYLKGVKKVEDIGLMYGILDEIKKRNGYNLKDIRERLDKKLNLISWFDYN